MSFRNLEKLEMDSNVAEATQNSILQCDTRLMLIDWIGVLTIIPQEQNGEMRKYDPSRIRVEWHGLASPSLGYEGKMTR
jgi:hypothetical protein